MVLAAVGAIALSWHSAVARNSFIASLLVPSLEILIPAFFSRFIQDAQEIDIGPCLRVIPRGLASILAIAGLYNYSGHK